MSEIIFFSVCICAISVITSPNFFSQAYSDSSGFTNDLDSSDSLDLNKELGLNALDINSSSPFHIEENPFPTIKKDTDRASDSSFSSLTSGKTVEDCTHFPAQNLGFISEFEKLKKHGTYEANLPRSSEEVKDLINTGISLYNEGKSAEAMNYYERALSKDPSNIYALNNKGFLLYNQGKINESIAYYDKALKIKPIFYDALYNKGLARMDNRQFDDAEVCFREASYINSTSPDLQNNWGISTEQQAGLVMMKYQFLKNFFEHNQNSSHKFPNSSQIFRDLAGVDGEYMPSSLKNTKPAFVQTDYKIRRVELGMANDLNNLKTKQVIGTEHVNKTKVYESIKKYNKGLEQQPNNMKILINKARALCLLENFQDSMPVVDHALSINATYGPANYYKGVALKGLGEVKEATLYFQMSDPNYNGEPLKSDGMMSRPL